jgi:Spy/CpxP family protein refolding chaperone
MKRLTQITLVAAVLVMASGAASAQERQRQRPGGGGGFGGGPMFLLGQPSVQKELKLSDEQIKKIKDLSDKQREAMQGVARDERRAKMQELAKANNKAIGEILKPEQMKRAKQLALQQQGTRALSNPEVAKALKLTDDQQEKIKDIQAKAREAAGTGQRGDRSEEATKKRAEARKATTEKVMGVLTPEQKTTLKDLQGEPFKFEPRTRGGRGRPQRPASSDKKG